MAGGGSLQLSHELGTLMTCAHSRPNACKRSEMKSRGRSPGISLSSCTSQHDAWSLYVSERIYRTVYHDLCRYNLSVCRAFAMPSSGHDIPLIKNATLALTRSYNTLRQSPLPLQLVPAIGIIAFAVWGLEPLLRYSRSLFFRKNDGNWKKSRTHYIFAAYVQPLLLWTGATLVCRALDPVVLPSEASQAVKQRLLIFVRSLSTVLAFAYCLSSLIQQTQKFFLEMSGVDDTRTMGFQFAGKAVYTAVWVAAFSLFMELLGFSTQKWVTAGGLGTVLLTLAGREIFTNFLSSVMIHATRPFVVNEWIQTKIEGYEVSGTVEHMGWWSPTIIRGDDREAVHIPNHKFTVSVVRNLSQKTHWRIKTHLAISHLDVSKINNIVADMRKVLAKNPQIEQQRLHRRVFLDNINPENQALLILVSCFVKTSHFEEYLCVKEAVLLDLLRVISHHRARLATPIRTMQKVYTEADMENIPVAETIFTHPATSTTRPLFLVEPSTRINSEDKTKARPTCGFGPAGVRTERADQYKGRVTPFVVFACIVAAVGGSIFGYDIGISGGVTSMDPFLQKFFPVIYRKKNHESNSNYCKYDNQGLAAFTSSLYLAGLVASIAASPVTRNYGRRVSIICGGLSFLAGAALNVSAINLAMLYLGRIMLGIGIGFGNQAVPLYLSEMAPAKLRGGLNMMFQLATTLGIFSANMINYGTQKINPWGWRLSLGLAAAPAFVMTIGGFLLPETPNSLIEQGLVDEGRRILEKIRGTANVDAEFQDMVEASELANSIKHPFRNILERKNRPQLVMAIFMPTFQILTGINSILFYAPVLFQSLGFGSNASLYSSVATGAVLCGSTLISIAIVDKLGRRKLLISGGIQMITCQVIVAIILGVKFGNDKQLSKAFSVIVVVVFCLFVLAFGWSWGPLGWTVPSEIFPLEIRSAGQSITVAVNLFFTFVIAQSFLALLCSLKFGIFLFFASWIVVMTIFVYFFLPETKGIPIEEMVLIWRKHWFWKTIMPPLDPEGRE